LGQLKQKSSFYPIFLGILFWLSCVALEARKAPTPIQTHQLPNGLRIHLKEKSGTGVVAMQVWYKVGGANEKEGQKGLAHLFEHMMFRGSENFGPEEHSQKIRAVGGHSNAYTSDDVTVYHQVVPAAHIDMVLALEADRMRYLKLNDTVLKTEIEIVKEEFRLRYLNSPNGDLFMKARRFLFANHPYMWGPIGKMEDLDTLTVEKAQAFYKKYYAPNNATLIIVGDFNSQKVLQRITHYFGAYQKQILPPSPSLALSPASISPVLKSRSLLPIPITVFSFYLPPAAEEDTLSLQILYSILSDGKSARLWKRLVREKQIAYTSSGFFLTGQGPGLFTLFQSHLPFHASKIKKAIWKEIESIQETGVDPSELKKAQAKLLHGEYSTLYLSRSIASAIGEYSVIEKDISRFGTRAMAATSITNQDIIRVAKKYLVPENAKILYFSPKKQNPFKAFFIGLWGLIQSIF